VLQHDCVDGLLGDLKIFFSTEKQQQRQRQMRGFFPFDCAQGQNDRLLFSTRGFFSTDGFFSHMLFSLNLQNALKDNDEVG